MKLLSDNSRNIIRKGRYDYEQRGPAYRQGRLLHRTLFYSRLFLK